MTEDVRILLKDILDKRKNEVVVQSFSDSDKRKNPNTPYSELADNISKGILKAFEDENKFVNCYRKVFSILIVGCVSLSIIAMLITTSYIVKYNNLTLATIITIYVSFIGEISTLMVILFKYLFNRENNKLCDILRDTLSIVSNNDIEDKKHKILE